MTELEVARYALRTFTSVGGQLESPYTLTPWKDGTCQAECLRDRCNSIVSARAAPDHDIAPHPECLCGIYGSLSLDGLRVLPEASKRLIAVIAAEGETIIGSRGLRTQYARIVAYWLSTEKTHFPDHVYHHRDYGYAQYEKACHSLGIPRFDTPEALATSYGLPISTGDRGPSWRWA